MKDRIIFSKYSNDRAGCYEIATHIFVGEHGRFVRKCAMNESAISHVMNLKKIEDCLQDAYKESRFRINRSLGMGKDYIDYEYVQGISYEQLLDQYNQRNDLEGLIRCMKDVFQEYTRLDMKEFVSDALFEQYFGKVELPTGSKGIPNANVDLIFQNILVDKTGVWNVIDYEWTLGCMLPVRFLEYRSIYLYIYSQEKRRNLVERNLFELFDFTEEELKIYQQMEQHFQQVIKAGHLQMGDYHQKMGKLLFRGDAAFSRYESRVMQVASEPFETTDIKVIQECIDNPLYVDIEGVSRIRMCPQMKRGMVKIKKFQDKKENPLAYETNGRMLGEDMIYFEQGEAGYIDIPIGDGVEGPVFVYALNYPIDEEVYDVINRWIHIEDSLSWKITKPLRILLDKLHK